LATLMGRHRPNIARSCGNSSFVYSIIV
jgi:hypothetical protein